MGSNSPYLRSLSGVPNPANTLLYIENVGRYAWQHRDPAAQEFGGPFAGILPTPEYPESEPGPQWHGKGWLFNASYADGHATYIRMKSYAPVEPYPANMMGKCAGQGEFCKWIMIRGPQWQIDCLPAPPVETRHPCPAEGRPCQDGEDIAGWVAGVRAAGVAG
jgi:prepilin-type processing-associated H-X9-DG protein